MPIPQRVVDKYLNRPVESLSWLKQLTPTEVDKELSYIRPRPHFRVPLRTDQKVLFLLGVAYPGVLLMSDLGAGKGHPVGTKILTPTGYRNIEILRCGDEVIGSNGRPTTITGVHHRGKLPVYKVGFNDGTSLKVDGDHLWAVAPNHHYHKTGNYRPISTAKIQSRMQASTFCRDYIPLVQPVEFAKADPLLIPPYTLGVLIGDGYLGDRASFTPGDDRVPDEVARELPPPLFLTKHINKGKETATSWIIVTRTGNGGRWLKNPITESLKQLGLYGVKSGRRFIPDCYLTASIDDRISLLQGLMDTDGKCSRKSPDNEVMLSFSTTSKRLADNVVFLVQSLGGTGRPYEYIYNTTTRQVCHTIYINLPPNIIPLRAHAGKWGPRKHHLPQRRIMSIKEAGSADVICLSVSASNKLYVADNFIVTHNTVVSLELLTYFYENGFIRRGFVFAPTDEVAEVWDDEITKWGFELPHVRLTGSSQHKWEQLQELNDGIAIGTYIGISAMVSKLRPIEGSKKQKREILPRLILGAVSGVDAVVYDQSTKLGSTDSLSFNVCREFSREAQLRYGLAGRAFGRDPFIIWSQLYLVDDGVALGTSPGMVREAFWYRVKSPWGTSWKIRKRREPILAHFISASSIRYSIDECVELPPKVYVQRECDFPEENWAHYEQVREELIASRGNYREVQSSFLRMRQISSGFVGFRDDETDERAQIEFEHNPKLELLMQLVEEVPEDRKMVIFYEFTWSGARICQELAKLKLKHGWLWAGTKDWTRIKDAFNTDPEFRIIVANWRKGSMGLNLQAANYEFFYESPVSSIERYESEGRVRRTGQQRTSFIYDVMVRDSADQRILELHKEGATSFRSLVENPAKYFGRYERERG